jgi:dihydroflavonol-4-reductase
VSEQLVVVTGATGFIALHCVRELLQAGYRVRGTMRSLVKEPGVRKALAVDAEAGARLAFVEADLDQDAGWSAAMEGATFVLHVASPLPPGPPKHVDDLVRPARDGTLRVLRAARDAGVRRVVMTSSVAAVSSGHAQYDGRPFTEEDWSNLDGAVPPYETSKTKAERAAWEFMQELGDESSMDLVAVNPSFVLGPSLLGADNTSNEVVAKLIRREVPGCPSLMVPAVDVRDVARAQVLAMTTPDAAGKRFILSGEELWYLDIARMLKEAGYEVTTRKIPSWFVRIVALFDPTVRLAVPMLGKPVRYSTKRARSVLGWSTRPFKETLLDTAADVRARAR